MSYPYILDTIPTFGALTASAIALATWTLGREVKRYETLCRLKPGSHEIVIQSIAPALLFALLGARVFHILDFPREFLADPAAMIFTRAGFSIFGGLVFGIVAGIISLRRHAVPVVPVLDALAPALALGYAVGRIGCQIAGDGDWGIAADMSLKPEWLPQWLWAQTYNDNVLGMMIAPPGVYPTPLYETAMALMMFGVLWVMRSQRYAAGYLFSVYLLLSGFERLLIEKIRINVHYHALGFSFTQAEAVAFALIVGGFVGVLVSKRSARLVPRLIFSVAVLSALSACVSH